VTTEVPKDLKEEILQPLRKVGKFMGEKEKQESARYRARYACFMMDVAWHHQADGIWRRGYGTKIPSGKTCGRAPWISYCHIVRFTELG